MRRLSRSKKNQRRSGLSWVRVSNQVKVLSFAAVFAVVGSAYLPYSHAATTTSTTDTVMTGDMAVTDDGALDASDPAAGAIDNTTPTLIDNYDGTSRTDAASVSCAKFTLNRIVHGPDGKYYYLNNDRYGNGDECASKLRRRHRFQGLRRRHPNQPELRPARLP